MLGWHKKKQNNGITCSSLYSQAKFYAAFTKDISNCHQELIIESPFITVRRSEALMPILKSALDRGVKIVINTKDPVEIDNEYMQQESMRSVASLQAVGINVLYTVGHHRKLAILDRNVLWEGSLNILSQNDSCEIMRRIDSDRSAIEMLQFINIEGYLAL